MEGDQAYEAGDFEKAVLNYRRAYDLMPESIQTAEQRAAARQRLAQASVERARQLARVGDTETADQLLASVLAPGVAPSHLPAEQMRERLQDPLRSNPALSPKHVADVDEVRRLLYEAHAFNDLGEFDRAITVFNAVLRIDPYNTAARRGMETATRHKQDYFRSARDETRARLLSETAAQWETAVPRPVYELADELGMIREGAVAGRTASEKLDSIVIPFIDLDQVGLREAIDFLRQRSRTLDTTEPDPEQRGVAFVIELGNADPDRAREIENTLFDLQLRNVPLRKVLDYISDATGTAFRVDQHAVVIRPAGAVGDDLVFRQFRVPPDFLSREAVDDGAAAADPFGDDTPERGLVRSLTAEEFLKNQGVDFPPGANATFSPSSSILSVRNTATNMRLVETIVEVIADAEPVMITIETRILRAGLSAIKEAGMDWLLETPKISGDFYLGGGSTGTGTPLGGGQLRPITAGNRSGNLASTNNAIDAAIQRSPVGNANQRAPGILTATGFINDEAVVAIMRGVNQNKSIDLMTKKTVVTRSGQEATIESINEFIYPTEYEPPEIPNQVGATILIDGLTGQVGQQRPTTPVTPATPTAFETTNLGCEMTVLPQLGEDGKVVEVAIKPSIRRLDGFIDYGTPIFGGSQNDVFGAVAGIISQGTFGIITENSIVMPVISTIRGDSVLTIVDGETVVMGGLISESRIKVEDQVPILGRIPLVGGLFQSEADTTDRQALIILVTVRLQDPAGEFINQR